MDATELQPGVAVTLGLRPEKLSIAAQPASEALRFSAKVRPVEQLGREAVLYAEADAAPLRTSGSDSGTANVTVQLSEPSRRSSGEPIELSFDPVDAYLFSPSDKTVSVARRDPS